MMFVLSPVYIHNYVFKARKFKKEYCDHHEILHTSSLEYEEGHRPFIPGKSTIPNGSTLTRVEPQAKVISYGATISLRKQLEHVAKRKLEDRKYEILSRRFFGDDMAPSGSILGVPSLPSHLPEAEPILPGHTLLRPALGMLKSAVKFPHRDLENGAGVYGNIDNLGIRYDGLNERIMYTGFRRTPSDYILVLPQMSENYNKPKFILGAPISVRSGHFYTDPKDENEINENRLETQRAIEEFFQKAKEGLVNSQRNRKSSNKNQVIPKLTQKNILRLQVAESSSSEEDLPETHDIVSEIHSSQEDKKTWFANTKYAFTHLNVNSDAPEHSEFLPLSDEDVEEIRKWWYYNQCFLMLTKHWANIMIMLVTDPNSINADDDFEPFDVKELSKLIKPDKKGHE